MGAAYSTADAKGVADAGATSQASNSIVVPSGAVIYCAVTSSDSTDVDCTGVKWDAAGVNESFTQIGTTIIHNQYARTSLWRLVSPTAKTAVVTASWGSNQAERLLVTWVGTGIDTGTPNGTVYQNNGTGTGVSTGAMTTTSGKLSLAFGTAIHYETSTWSMDSPTGTERAEATTLSDAYDVGAVQEYTAIGTSTTLQWTLSASPQSWACFGLELNDAAGGGATTPKGPLGNPFFGPFGGPI